MAQPQDPNTASRGMPIPGAAASMVPTPVPAQVARPDLATVAGAPGAVAGALGGALSTTLARPDGAPVSPVAGGGFNGPTMTPQALADAKAAQATRVADAFAGPTSLALATNARDAYGQGQYLQAGVGALASGVTALGHVAKSGLDFLGQADHDGVAALGRGAAYATGQVMQGLGLQAKPVAAADPSLSPLPAPDGPALPAGALTSSPFGITYDRTTGPTLDQAKAINAASLASMSAAPAPSALVFDHRGTAPAAGGPPTASAAAPVAAGVQGQSVAGPYSIPAQVAAAPAQGGGAVSLIGNTRLQNFLITHPSVGGPAAQVMSGIEGARGVQQTNDVNQTISDAYRNKYMQTAGQKQGESDADYLTRRYGEQIQLAKDYATYSKPAFAVANQVNN